MLCTLRDAELRRRNSLAQQKRGGQSEDVPEEAEAAEESSRVLAHARALFFHDLHIRSQRHGSVLALPCDARFGHNCRN
jgi:hypothetical protein